MDDSPSTMDDLPPPPPYTPHDPANSPSQGSRSYDTAVEVSINVYSGSLPDHEYISGAPYFAIRPTTQPRPLFTIQHRVSILPNSSPENIKFPGPEFVRRGLNQYDWSTFLNHLFPLHGVNRKIGNGSSSDEKSPDVKGGAGSTQMPSQTFSRTAEVSRPHIIRAALSEWNTHFFVPRGIRIVADIKSAQSPPAAIRNPIDAKPFGGETALYKAISASDLGTVEILLSKGADPNAKAFGGEPAVHRAVSKVCNSSTKDVEDQTKTKTNNDRQILELLLAHGADVDANPPGMGTPLHVAASKGDSEMVELFLRYGADPNSKPLWGETPLYAAAKSGDVCLVKRLIAAGADTDDSPPGCESALNGAVGRGDRAVVDLLLEAGAALEEKHWTGGSPVQAAARRGDVDVLRKLLERGAKVDAPSAGLPTALGEATSRGDIEVVKVCLEFGADPGKQKWGLESPLAIAVGKGDPELLNMMLDAIGGPDDIRAQARKIAMETGQSDLLKPSGK